VDFDKAIELNPSYAEAYYHRGLVYERLKESQKSQEDLNEAARLFREQQNLEGYQTVQKLLNNPDEQNLSQEPPTISSQSQAQAWLTELEEKAKQITVRIDNLNDGSNGSGVIVARKGNTYYILTNAHVVGEKTAKYEILAPDGTKYSIDPAQINREEGVDLAVVQFSSDLTYQIATLANYSPTQHANFVAGYPKLGKTEANWRFSLGSIFAKEEGLLRSGV
jgi:S1-C subfamily serine protease